MYVDRDSAGAIVMAWNEAQREGHELVPLDRAELQTFLALPSGRWDEARLDQVRWA